MGLGSIHTKLRALLEKGTFARHVVTLMTGTTIAQAIPLAAAPLLTRIFAPEDFGILALFVAITSIIGSIATARYELAVMLPKSDEDAVNVVVLALAIAVGMSILLLIAVALFNHQIATFVGNQEIAPWLYAAPAVVLLLGAFNTLRYFNIRKENYKAVASATAYRAGAGTAVQVLLGSLVLGPAGLLVGHIVSHIVGNTKLFLNAVRYGRPIAKLRRVDVIEAGRTYIDFPKFSLWAVLANSLSHNVVHVFISTVYTVASLGFYALVKRVLDAPTTLIGRAIGDVFFHRAADERRRTGTAVHAFTSTLQVLLVLAIPFYTVLYLVSEPLFAFVFGEEWRIAGTYAKFLVLLLGLQFVSSPLSIVSAVFEKQRISLLWQLGLLFLTVLVFAISASLAFAIETFLLTYSVTLATYYLFKLWLSYTISKGLL